MTDILQLRSLRKTFPGGVTAVDDISLDIREGEFITLLGPSGCGKTTTLRMIAGFEKPDEGRVFLGGGDITETPPYRRNVNTVFQDYALFPHLTIRDNVAYGLKRSNLGKDEIVRQTDDALARVELSDKAALRPHMLSGGQKQRVALARALVCNPKVLLLDEPLSALDAKLREAMQVELKTLHETIGLTFILVTHDQNEAMVMSDRVVIMEKGRIVQIGLPSELYERPVNAYVADFIGTSNFVEGVVSDVDGRSVSVRVGGDRITIADTPGTHKAGDSVTLCARPEKMSILPEGTQSHDTMAVIPGVLVNCYFHGSYVRYSVETGNGRVLLG